MWNDKYDAYEYLNKQEAVNFLSEVITEFQDRRQNYIELKVNISDDCRLETFPHPYFSGSESGRSPGCVFLRLLFPFDDLQSLRL